MKFPLIDLHQDLLAHIQNLEMFPFGTQADFSMLERTHTKIVVATAFPLPPEDNFFDPVTNELIEKDFAGYMEKTRIDPNWSIIQSAADIDTVLKTEGKHGLILHVEGLNVVDETSFDRLERWYQLGWRSLGIVWSLTNPLGGGTQDPTTGLSPLGRTMLAWLQERRMIVDFAHMNRPTFWDAIKIVKGPIVVSHGNACARCPSPRNYEDDQLQAVAERDGIVGVFLANTYVVGRGNPGKIRDAADHVDHLVDIMGIDHVAMGTDFGGIITGLLEGLETLEKLPAFWAELTRRGYSEDDLEKIAWKNAARTLKAIL